MCPYETSNTTLTIEDYYIKSGFSNDAHDISIRDFIPQIFYAGEQSSSAYNLFPYSLTASQVTYSTTAWVRTLHCHVFLTCLQQRLIISLTQKSCFVCAHIRTLCIAVRICSSDQFTGYIQIVNIQLYSCFISILYIRISLNQRPELQEFGS